MGKLGSIFSRKITLYKEYYSRDLVAFQFSAANLMSVMIWVFMIFLPFIVAFNGGDLWQKGQIVQEQPTITFNNKFYINALFRNNEDDSEKIQFNYASVKPIRDNIQNSLAPPSVTTIPIDSNRDGIIDQYNITMRIKKPLQKLNLQ